MKQFFIIITISIMGLTSCNTNKPEGEKGIDLSNMDLTAIPGNDFFRYATGGWNDKNPLTNEHARYGTIDKLHEASQEQVLTLIEEVAGAHTAPGSLAQKIGNLYEVATDSARLNREGTEPILAYLKKIAAIKDKDELPRVLAEMFRDGVSPFFNIYIAADDKNSDLNILHLYQGGFKMGDRDYYLENDPRTQEIREKYKELIEKLFLLANYTPDAAKAAVSTVMDIETALAQAAYSRVELRDPEKNYHKISLEELKKVSPAFKWGIFFEETGLKNVTELNLSQPEPIEAFIKALQKYSLEEIRDYLSWCTLNSFSSFLSDDFVNASFDFYGRTLSGTQELRPRWKRAVNVVNGCLGEAVGQLYVEKHFPPQAKERMLQLVTNLQTALGERIASLTWMQDVTKEKAQEKLASFRVKIGYPDKWRDYSSLVINREVSYMDNIIQSNHFDFDFMISKFNKPVDKDEWFMNPQTVNAYYNPSSNEICFPAGILQPPFFNLYADDAVNYGAIGVVIGHEMTHGFDDQGRMFDKDGNLNDWWTPEDAENFKARTQALVDFYDNIIVIDSLHVNGRLTLGENIADQGGLQVSWQAYLHSLNGETPEPVDGFTGAQRFFINYAMVWAGNIRNEEIYRLTKIDPHSLGKWRVNGALPHIDAWYEAFDVTPENKLYVTKEDRVSIW